MAVVSEIHITYKFTGRFYMQTYQLWVAASLPQVQAHFPKN